MDLTESFRALALEHPGDIGLEELDAMISQAYPEDIDRSQGLEVMMGWLHEQIQRGRDVQHGSFLHDFVNLLRRGSTWHVRPFTKEEMNEAFETWQNKAVIENPINRHIYQRAISEIQKLYGQDRSKPLPQQESLEHMHGNRVALLRLPVIDRSLEDISNRERQGHIFSGGEQAILSTIPLQQQNNYTSNTQETTDISDGEDIFNLKKSLSGHLPRANTDTRGRDLNAPTITRETTVQGSPDKMPWASGTSVGPGPNGKHNFRKHHRSLGFSMPPSESYICKRCGRKGKQSRRGI